MSSRNAGFSFGRPTSPPISAAGPVGGYGGGQSPPLAINQQGAMDGAGGEDFAAGTLPMTEKDLPPPNTKRWVMRRKAEVVAGVRCGLISLDEACRRYTLSVEEFLSWQRLIDSHGVRGLRATRLQDYRSGEDEAGGRD